MIFFEFSEKNYSCRQKFGNIHFSDNYHMAFLSRKTPRGGLVLIHGGFRYQKNRSPENRLPWFGGIGEKPTVHLSRQNVFDPRG